MFDSNLFFSFHLFIYLFTPPPNSSPLLSQSPDHSFSSSLNPLPPMREGVSSISPTPLSHPPPHPTLAHQVTAFPGASSPTKARQGCPAKGTVSIGRQEVQGQPHSNCWTTCMKTTLHICYTCVGSSGCPAHAQSLVGGSVSGSSQ